MTSFKANRRKPRSHRRKPYRKHSNRSSRRRYSRMGGDIEEPDSEETHVEDMARVEMEMAELLQQIDARYQALQLYLANQ